MEKLTQNEMKTLAGISALDVYARAVEFGNYHVYEWLAGFAKKNTEEENNDNESERV